MASDLWISILFSRNYFMLLINTCYINYFLFEGRPSRPIVNICKFSILNSYVQSDLVFVITEKILDSSLSLVESHMFTSCTWSTVVGRDHLLKSVDLENHEWNEANFTVSDSLCACASRFLSRRKHSNPTYNFQAQVVVVVVVIIVVTVVLQRMLGERNMF